MRFSKVIIFLFFLFNLQSFTTEIKNEEHIENSYEYFNVYDPFEPLNRRIYYFNYQFDKYIFLPTIRIYHNITPAPIRKGVTNFFDNTTNITTTGNSILQFKISKAMRAIGRFTMNITLGFGGIFDTASELGMPKPYEDFGLTLAHYGVGKGPYLVLPILGPSFLRDAFGTGVDTLGKGTLFHDVDFDEMNHLLVTTIFAIDKRDNTPFRYYETGSPFEYEYIRFLYYKYRDLQAELGTELF